MAMIQQPATDTTLYQELWALAEKDPREPCVRAARWLLRGLVDEASNSLPVNVPTTAELAEVERESKLAAKRIRDRGSTVLSLLKNGDNLTRTRYQHIVAAGREADAIEILTRQGRLQAWITMEEGTQS
jgi:hypothetical protein